jgi:hypothetical protein
MATVSANVDVAVTGAFSFAPTSATAPTDATTALPVDFQDVGYIGEDGVTETRDRSTTNIIAWQNADNVRSVVTESSITVQFVGIESNANMIGLYYGAEVATDGSVEIVPASTGGRRACVLDYVDGDKLVRMYMPEAELLETGDLVMASGEPVGYDVTITGYPGIDGWSAKKWFSALDTSGT